MSRLVLILALLAASSSGARAEDPRSLRVGSKRFTESYLLAEMAVALLGEGASQLQGLGGTAIAYRALEEGSVDLYPEYTGTLSEEILRSAQPLELGTLRASLGSRGLGITAPLGFDNSYALVVPGPVQERLGLKRISDLGRHPELRIALSHEFFGRRDGWPRLVESYGLEGLANVRAMDHGLAYAAIGEGAADLTDGYSTDAQLVRYGLRTLEDDRRVFPVYQAVFLYRLDAARRHPEAFARLLRMEGRLDAATMARLNGQAEQGGQSFERVARAHLSAHGLIPASVVAGPASDSRTSESLWTVMRRSVRQYGPRHLLLVVVSLALAVIAGIPLGIAATRSRVLGQLVLGAVGLIQTIPSLALLCFFIPIWGTGLAPSLAALFLYGLLPIVRNTFVGLKQIPAPIQESARALGLPGRVRLWRIYLPLAAPTLIAGVKTAAVIGVGTATLAAFIGAGGFGQPIGVGLNLNDSRVILSGAIPAAGLALVIQAVFELLERLLVPQGVRPRIRHD